MDAQMDRAIASASAPKRLIAAVNLTSGTVVTVDVPIPFSERDALDLASKLLELVDHTAAQDHAGLIIPAALTAVRN